MEFNARLCHVMKMGKSANLCIPKIKSSNWYGFLYFQIKTTHNHKGPHEFDNLMYVQEIAGNEEILNIVMPLLYIYAAKYFW